MKTHQAWYAMSGALPPLSVTLGDQVRTEARRRGGVWASHADECARRAEAWYGRHPCRGEDLQTVFSEVFRHE